MTRTRFRVTAVLAGLLVLAAGWLAPRVPPGAIVYLSLAWLAATGWIFYALFLILRSWIGGVAAGLVIGVLAATPIALTALPVAPSLAVRLPCPRNWGWLPTRILRSSPMGSIAFTLGSATIKICYGRPASRGRRMIGGKYVPFGRLWRTGANEPTTIISTGPIEIAGIAVPVGRSSLYTVPGPETWEIILNRSVAQWGIESEYSDAVKAHELGRAILPSGAADPPVERLTLTVEAEAGGHSDRTALVLRWERTRIRIPIRPASR